MHHDENGSLILTLLAALVVGALAVGLFTVTTMGTKTANRDRDYNLAITGADAGVQQALSYIQQLGEDPATELNSTVLVPADESVIGDVDVVWSATKASYNRWVVTATGTLGGVSRTVQATVKRPARFFLGAFSDLSTEFRGGNGSDSYDGTVANNGNGSIGSNGVITMRGNAYSDYIFTFGPGSYCTHNGSADGSCAGKGDLEHLDDRVDVESLRSAIQTAMDAECSSFTSYTASSGPALVGGNVYCFTDVYFDKTTDLVNASTDNPVVIYMTGDFDTKNGIKVNCSACTGASSQPDAGSLVVFSTGESWTLGNHNYIAIAAAVPSASCDGSPSNAQGDIYGSIICSVIDNQGGWKFHYDERLSDKWTGVYDITDWREEVG